MCLYFAFRNFCFKIQVSLKIPMLYFPLTAVLKKKSSQKHIYGYQKSVLNPPRDKSVNIMSVKLSDT